MSKKFNHLLVPDEWRQYWTKYPEGYTILESIINWVSQVDKMVDNINDWNKYLDEFVKTFDKNLQSKVSMTLQAWYDDGTLAKIINEDVFNMKADKEYVDAELAKKADSVVVPTFMNDIPMSTGVTAKAIERTSESRYNIFSKRPYGDKYLMFVMERGVVTENNSVGGRADLLRLTNVIDMENVYVYAHEYDIVGGTWENWTKRVEGAGNTYRDISFWRNTGSNQGDYIRFNVTVDETGEFTLMFYTTATSDPAARILVGSTEVGTVNLSQVTDRIYIAKFKAPPGSHQVRVMTSGDYYIYCAGYNASTLKNAQADKFVDSIAFGGNNSPYINSKGAVDYAFYDSDIGQYYGSFHGGETLVNEQMVLDGRNTLLQVGQTTLKNSFGVRQRTNIYSNYTSDTYYHLGGDGLMKFSAHIKGDANLSTMYSAMTTAHNDFSLVTYPIRVATDTDGEYSLGKTNLVTQENPNTGQRIHTFVTLFSDNRNNFQDGVFIRRTTGAYNKLYYGQIVQRQANLKEISYQTAWLFE